MNSDVAYMKSDRVHQFIRQLMALPYLPKEYIRSSFNRLYLTVPVSARPLRRFMSYIKYTWITSSKFPVNTWSVFGQPVRKLLVPLVEQELLTLPEHLS
jgi:hypothetical protein